MDQLTNSVNDALNNAVSTDFVSLLKALAILIIGWVFAVIVSAVVRLVLGRLNVNERVAKLSEEDASIENAPDIEKWSGRIVFWMIMLAVFAQFFLYLNLTQVSESLAGLSDTFMKYLAELLSAGLVLFMAWIVALIVRFVVLRIARLTNFDERLQQHGGLEEDQPLAVSTSLATAAYWLTFLFFLPAVLGSVSFLDDLVVPVQEMMSAALAMVPQIFAAGIILLVGWITARIVRKIVVSLLVAAGADHLGDRVGFNRADGKRSLSWLIGTVVYALMLILFAIAALDALQIAAITVPAVAMLTTLLGFVPKVLGAAVILFVFYFVGKLVAELVTEVLRGIGFDAWPQRIGLSEGAMEGERSPSDVAGLLTLAAIVIFGAAEASTQLGFTTLEAAFQAALVFGGQLLLAGAVLVIGLWLANLARTTILSAGGSNADLVSRLASYAVIIFAGAIALLQVGIGSEVVLVVIAMVLGAIALSVALAFGLGGREVAGRQLERWVDSFDWRRRNE